MRCLVLIFTPYSPNKILINIKNTMKSKNIACAILPILFILFFSQSANSVPTTWDKVDLSMAQLLNSGWQIVAQSAYRSVFVAPNNYLDSRGFTYTLFKGGKYITCIIEDPKPPIANTAACRKLN
jgi:hypothetical protein